jgi:DNA uptake protein ComE-like DNA-binding protein
MPDNATVGLNTVAADELVTVNGVAQVEPLPKAERVKIGHGGDGDFTDVSAASPMPTADAALLSTLSAVLAELQQKLEAGQAVALDSASLAALESITATLSGPVALDTATLAALETIQVGNLPADPATQTTLAAILTKLTADPATGARQDKLMTATSAVSYGTGTANAVPVAPAEAAGRLMGYSVREAAATPAAAVVRFRSGATVAGTPLGAGVSLAPGESVREWFGPAGINVPTAVFLERVSGTTEVTVYWSAP